MTKATMINGMVDDKSDAYISIIAIKEPAPNTFWGWHYHIRLEQFGKIKEVWGLYERNGRYLIPHYTNRNENIPQSLPRSMIDRYEN